MYKYPFMLGLVIICIINIGLLECAPGQTKGNRAGISMDQETYNNNKIQKSGSGISAWGLIFIILLIIFICAGGYYGIICYPLICKKERNYAIMDGSSSNTTTPTPTISGEFEKHGNYSSRSTTPSRSQ